MRLLAEILIIAALIYLRLEQTLQRTRRAGKHNNLNQTPRSRLEDAKTPGPVRAQILARRRLALAMRLSGLRLYSLGSIVEISD